MREPNGKAGPLDTILVVHGTRFGEPEEQPEWWQPGGSFCRELDERLRAAGHAARTWAHLEVPARLQAARRPFAWKGSNSEIERRKAGEALAGELAELERMPEVGRVHLVAHSHGGSVVAHALRSCRRPLGKLGRVVFLGTPFLVSRASLVSRLLSSLNLPLALVALGALAWGAARWIGQGERPGLGLVGIFLGAVVLLALYSRRRRRGGDAWPGAGMHAILMRAEEIEIDEAFAVLETCVELTRRKSKLRQGIDGRLRRSGRRFSLQLSRRLVGWSTPYGFLEEQIIALGSDEPPWPVAPGSPWAGLLTLLNQPPCNLWKVPLVFALFLGLLLAVPLYLLDLVVSCLYWVWRQIVVVFAIRSIPSLARSLGLGDDVLGETIVGVGDRPHWSCQVQTPPSEVVAEVERELRGSLGESAGQVVRKLNTLTREGLETGIELAFDGLVHCSYTRHERIIARVAEILAGETAKP